MHCSRAKGAEAGNDKSRTSKTNRGIECSIFAIPDLLLLHEAGVLKLILIQVGVQVPCESTKETILISAIDSNLV